MSVPVAALTDRRAPAGPARSRIDPVAWPDVARVPGGSPPRTALARLIVGRALARLPLRVRLGGGPVTGDGGPVLRVSDPPAFFHRIGADGLIGFGESYMAGEWDTDDLVGVLTVLAEHVGALVPQPLQRLRGVWARRRPRAPRNTLAGARENIHRHYDLSNDLFALFLDETMSYSSAVFEPPPINSPGSGTGSGTGLPGGPAELSGGWAALPSAQHRKIDRLLDLAGVGPGTRLLEIGTGWGELALRAAERGARVTSVTLSDQQRDLARTRIAAAGHADRVSVELRDYREVEGSYDAVVSVEMIEAVGADYWPVYFRALDKLVAPGGRIALQAITIGHERMLATRDNHTWIHKYVFPGGVIPSVEAIEQHSAAVGLRVERNDGYGPHYAETLRLWRERFTQQADAVAALGFDATFRALWEFYLAYSEAGFRSRYLDVRQLLLRKREALNEGGAR